MKMYLPYKTFYLGPSYSAAYNSYNPVNESNCLQFCIWQYNACKGHGIVNLHMHKSLYNKDIKTAINDLYSVVHKYNVCNMN